jgi:hypothetical protein
MRGSTLVEQGVTRTGDLAWQVQVQKAQLVCLSVSVSVSSVSVLPIPSPQSSYLSLRVCAACAARYCAGEVRAQNS